MKCPKCGYDNKKGIQFCVKCNNYVNLTPLEKIEPIQKKSEIVLEDIHKKEEKKIEFKETKIDKPQTINYFSTSQMKKDLKDLLSSSIPKRKYQPILVFVIVMVVMLLIIFPMLIIEDVVSSSSYETDEVYFSVKDSIMYDEIKVEYAVPDGMTGADEYEYFKTYHNDEYSKMISYMLLFGKSEEILNDEISYYLDGTNRNINVINSNKQVKYINNHKIEYAEILYEAYGEKYKLIIGCCQIGEYVYMVTYDDSTDENYNLQELFTFNII